MTRYFLPLAPFLILPLAAHAETLSATARVTAATVFGQGAELTWTISVDGPAGEGEVVVPLPPADVFNAALRVNGAEGIGILGYRVRQIPVGAVPEPKARIAARAALRAAEAEERGVLADQDKAEARVAAADAKIGFLARLKSDEAVAAPPPLDAIRAVADLVSAEVTSAWVAKQAALAEGREAEARLAEVRERLEAARAAYDATAPDDEGAAIVVDVAKAADGPVDLTLVYRISDAGWSPAYELTLDRAVGKVAMTRSLRVWQASGADWEDVALTLSTARIEGRTEQSGLYPDLRRIEPPAPPDQYDESGAGGMARPVMEEAPVVEYSASALPSLAYSGDIVTYRYARPVALATGTEFLTLPLDQAVFPATATAVAVPRYDQTAYLLVSLTNTGTEMLLPGPADLFRDGALIGQTQFGPLAPGVEAKVGFGPIEGLRLNRDMPVRSTGSRGVLTSSNEQEEKATLEVKNVGAEAWTVRLLDQVPYSEQEDLVVTWEATPEPSETDVDGRRGVLAWSLDVDPGETKTVDLTSRLTWPEGMELQ